MLPPRTSTSNFGLLGWLAWAAILSCSASIHLIVPSRLHSPYSYHGHHTSQMLVIRHLLSPILYQSDSVRNHIPYQWFLQKEFNLENFKPGIEGLDRSMQAVGHVHTISPRHWACRAGPSHQRGYSSPPPHRCQAGGAGCAGQEKAPRLSSSCELTFSVCLASPGKEQILSPNRVLGTVYGNDVRTQGKIQLCKTPWALWFPHSIVSDGEFLGSQQYLIPFQMRHLISVRLSMPAYKLASPLSV